MRRLTGKDAGQVAPLVAVLLLGLLALLGVVADGGAVLAARRGLQQLADGAARAGAAAVDEAALRDSAGMVVVVDEAAAEAAALSYLAEVGFGGMAEVTAAPTHVVVFLEQERPTMLGRVLGASSVTVRAEGQAAPRSGGL